MTLTPENKKQAVTTSAGKMMVSTQKSPFRLTMQKTKAETMMKG